MQLNFLINMTTAFSQQGSLTTKMQRQESFYWMRMKGLSGFNQELKRDMLSKRFIEIFNLLLQRFDHKTLDYILTFFYLSSSASGFRFNKFSSLNLSYSPPISKNISSTYLS